MLCSKEEGAREQKMELLAVAWERGARGMEQGFVHWRNPAPHFFFSFFPHFPCFLFFFLLELARRRRMDWERERGRRMEGSHPHAHLYFWLSFFFPFFRDSCDRCQKEDCCPQIKRKKWGNSSFLFFFLLFILFLWPVVMLNPPAAPSLRAA